MKVEPLYYTKKEVCALLRKSPATLDRWEAAGTFPKRKVPLYAQPVRDAKTGKIIRSHNCRVDYLRSEVDAYIAGTWKTAA